MTGITESEIERLLLEEPDGSSDLPRFSGKLVRQNGGNVPGEPPAAVPANDKTARDSKGKPLKKGDWVRLNHEGKSRMMKFLGTTTGENGSVALRFASRNGVEIKHPLPQNLVSSKRNLVVPIVRGDDAAEPEAAKPAPQPAPKAAPAPAPKAAAPQSAPEPAPAAAPTQVPARPNPNDALASERKRKGKLTAPATTDTGFTDSRGNPLSVGQTVLANGEPARVIGKMGKKWLRTNFENGKGILWTQEDITNDPDALVPYVPVDDAEAPQAEAPQAAPEQPQDEPGAPEAPEAAPADQDAPEAPQEAPQQAEPQQGDVSVNGVSGPVYADVQTNYYVHWDPAAHTFAITKGSTIDGKFTPQTTQKISNDQAIDLINKYGNAQGKERIKNIGNPKVKESFKLDISGKTLVECTDPATFEVVAAPKTMIKRRKKHRSS